MLGKVKIHNPIIIFFILACVLSVYMQFIKDLNGQLVCNLLSLFFLLILYVRKADKLNYWYVFNFLLVGAGSHFFIAGNVIYSLCFFSLVLVLMMKIVIDFLNEISLVKFLLPTFFFFVFFLIVYWLVKENITGFITLEVIFGFFLSFVGVLSFMLITQKHSFSNNMLFGGIFLFLISASFVTISMVIENRIAINLVVSTLYMLSQFLICRAMLYKSDLVIDFNKKSIIGIFFCAAIIVSLVFISLKDMAVVKYVKPISFLLFPVFYIAYTKTVNVPFIIYMILIFLVENLLLFFGEKFIPIVMGLAIISHLLMTTLIFYFKHIKLTQVLPYMFTLFVSYIILHYLLLTIEVKFIYIIFMFSHALMASSALTNYLKKMYMGNYLLWLGVSFGVLNVLIISSNPIESELNIYAYITNIISYYLIMRSFIVREDRVPVIA